MELLQRLKRDSTTRNKLLLTLGILFALMIGYRIPLPGINLQYLKIFNLFFSGTGAGNFINSVTGGSIETMSIFALSITPYISASILLQLASIFIPALEEIQKNGSVGKKKMERLTYIVGGIIAFIEALIIAIIFGNKGLFINNAWYMILYATVVWTSGACALIWVGQTITNKLIGNGISLILAFNIISTIPDSMTAVFNTFAKDSELLGKALVVLIMAISIFLIFAYVVVLEKAEKRIRITNSHKAGIRMTGADENVIPLKLNMGGVMPIIFSSSIMSMPMLLASLLQVDSNSILARIAMYSNQSNWFIPQHPIYTIGTVIYIALTFMFSYMYSKMTFNPKDIADNMRRSGSVIDGIRPGAPTAEFLQKQRRSMLWLGTSMLILVALLPTVISGIFGITSLSIGGTSVIIVVGAVLEVKNMINAQTSSVAYKTLVRRGRTNGKRNQKNQGVG